MKLQKDLKEFIVSLNSQKVDYLIVGGHAVAFHGHPRFTGDIDFFVRANKDNAQRLLDALKHFGFLPANLSQEDFLNPNCVVQIGRPPNRIDLLTSISGVDFDQAWRTKAQGELDELPVYFIGLEELLINKKSTGRAKDLGDVEELTEPEKT